jgi:hypothetical protein
VRNGGAEKEKRIRQSTAEDESGGSRVDHLAAHFIHLSGIGARLRLHILDHLRHTARRGRDLIDHCHEKLGSDSAHRMDSRNVLC